MALVRPILIKTDSQVTTIKRWEESVAVGFVDGSVKILDIETHK